MQNRTVLLYLAIPGICFSSSPDELHNASICLLQNLCGRHNCDSTCVHWLFRGTFGRWPLNGEGGRSNGQMLLKNMNIESWWPLIVERASKLRKICHDIFQDGLASLLRRTATWIMDNGGVVRKFENLGEQELPYKMKAHAERFTHGR